jgi:predicted TIM-barrel fold metal-dependent hydrolase
MDATTIVTNPLKEGSGVENVIEKKPLINCHTHIFTSKNVPPWLARTYLFWPAYYFLHAGLLVNILKWWYKEPDTIKYNDSGKHIQRIRFDINYFLYRLNPIYQLIGWFLTIQTFFLLYDLLKRIIFPDAGDNWIEMARYFLAKYHLLWIDTSLVFKTLMVVFILFFFKWGRNLILFIFKKIFKFFALLPGKQTLELFRRYLSIARYSSYKFQTDIFERLQGQYPKGSGFIALPMDMEFIGAGPVTQRYHEQMAELAKIKDNHDECFFPFVFIDPRRVAKEKETFFNYKFDNEDKQTLEECFIKDFIKTKGFSGFKIYPALGYYPFDVNLLPIWKYAADNQIPLMTHCIRGTIFYRGRKKKAWNEHDLFEQTYEGGTQPLLLPELENEKISWNFTHPLNYLGLLHEPFLRKMVGKADYKCKALFGYTDSETELKYNLSSLKICLAHFGGDDEWRLFLERDRDPVTGELWRYPERGVEFFTNPQRTEKRPGKIEQIWRSRDWYSIICSLMLQYDNIYADISYIVHNNDIQPLLKKTLSEENKKLRERVLFGTDFYVVRNHKSEKNMLVDSLAGLSEDEIDLIARKNPRDYLFNAIHGPVKM